MVKLGEVCEIRIGKTPARKNKDFWGEGLPWLSIKDMNQGRVIRETSEEITVSAVQSLKITPYPPGTVFFSFKLSIGKVGISEIEMFTNEAIAAIMPRDSSILLKDYLIEALENAGKRLQGNDAAMGATLNKKSLREIQIPLPPLEEQKRIAGILEASAWQLEKVQTALDSLRQMRSSLIEEYCATSEVTVNLDSLASVTGGLSLSGKRAVNPIECEYLRVANIQRNRFLIDDVKTIRCTEKELDRCLVDDGDILMLEANANPYEVGRAAIAETFGRQFVFQNHLFRIRPVGVSSIVLNALLESAFVRSQLLRVVKTTSGLNTMTINQARNLKVPQCAPAKNRRFDSQLELLSSQARNLESKQNLLRELHQSLATRAFAGEL